LDSRLENEFRAGDPENENEKQDVEQGEEPEKRRGKIERAP
jgi:hypothetical protein